MGRMLRDTELPLSLSLPVSLWESCLLQAEPKKPVCALEFTPGSHASGALLRVEEILGK